MGQHDVDNDAMVNPPSRKDKLWYLINEKKDAKIARQQAITNCVLDVGQAMLFLARVGLSINDAVEFCGDLEEEEDEHGMVRAQQICSIDVNGIIGSFAFATEYISLIATHCPVADNAKSECSASIAELLAHLRVLLHLGVVWT